MIDNEQCKYWGANQSAYRRTSTSVEKVKPAPGNNDNEKGLFAFVKAHM